MHTVFETISKIGIVPVIKLTDTAKAAPLAKALTAGGLPCAEVTFRTPQAAVVLRAMTDAAPDMLTGAGTVLTTAQVDEAVAAGAQFIVAPGLDPQVVRHCQAKGVPVLPGCVTPSELAQALALGLETVKFFPAEAAGGLAMIKALAAPYGQMRFVPTGGIDARNLLAYLSFDKVLACGGSWMVNENWLNDGAFDKVEQATREAVQTMLGFTLQCVHLNSGPDAKKETPWGVPDMLQWVDGSGRGARGHITVRSHSPERAAYYLERHGAVIDWSTAQRDAQGRLQAFYTQNEMGGFALRIMA